MGLRRGLLDQILAKNANASTEAYESAKGRQQKEAMQRAEADAKLAELIKGAELQKAQGDADLEAAQTMRSKYGPEADVAVGKARIGGVDPLMSLIRRRELDRPALTPGQIEAEKTAAKKLADYEAAGGRSTAEQNIKQIGEVQKDVAGGKRDWWDRNVGGMLSSSPGLMGVFASSEKARRDKVRNTAVMLARQSDPNPTEKQVDAIMGQIYDPASSDEANAARLQDYASKIGAINSQMSQAAENLSSTGYSMPGIGGNPAAPGLPAQGGLDAQKKARLEELRRKKAAGTIR